MSAKRSRRVMATAAQAATYPAIWFTTFVLSRAQVRSQLKLERNPQARYIIAANHQSRLDAFVIGGALGPKHWRQIFPYRFLVANQYLYHPRLKWLLRPMGGFPAYKTHVEPYGLRQAQALIEAGETVGIFPEGQRALPGEVAAKQGVAILAQMPGVYIIPVHLSWKSRQVKITIGEAYRAQGHSADEILERIYDLAEAQ